MCNHHESRLDGGHIAPAHDDEHHGVSRRTAVGLAGGGAVALLFAGIKGAPSGRLLDALGPDVAEAAAGACTMTPAKTVGPYFVEEQLNRANVVANADGTSAQTGVPLTLTLQVFDADNDCAAVSGATVDIWHANSTGLYSDESANGTAGQNWLRGYQTTDGSGLVTFTTIYPGWYSGRCVHLHFKVRIYDGSTETLEFTSQLFFTDAMNQQVFAANAAYTTRGYPDTTDGKDGIYGTDGGSLTLAPASDGSGGYTAQFSIGVAQSTSQLNNDSVGGGAGGGMAPGGTRPGGTTGRSGVSGTGTTVTSSGDTAVACAVKSAKMMRSGTGARQLKVTVKGTEAIAVAMTLTRGGKTVAKRTGKLAAGTRALKLSIPSAAKAGAATLTVVLADAAGNTKQYKRTVTIRTVEH